tara:strand:- start:20085 stop:20786 length:702 start_codon:yes stop_codon:yes gene_type:complete
VPRLYRRQKTTLIACSITLLFVLGWLSPITIAELWEWGSRVSGHPLAMLGVVILMAALMTFGLPGSLCFWIIAPFQPLLLSVCMLLAGSVGGALGAYRVGMGLGSAWHIGDISGQLIQLLTRRSDLLTQCALRIMPGVPHALINLAAGILGLRLVTFVSAAIIGLSIKWTVYSHAVHGMVSATQANEALEFRAVLPLVILGVLLVMGSIAKRYWFKTHAQPQRSGQEPPDTKG